MRKLNERASVRAFEKRPETRLETLRRRGLRSSFWAEEAEEYEKRLVEETETLEEDLQAATIIAVLPHEESQAIALDLLTEFHPAVELLGGCEGPAIQECRRAWPAMTALPWPERRDLLWDTIGDTAGLASWEEEEEHELVALMAIEDADVSDREEKLRIIASLPPRAQELGRRRVQTRRSDADPWSDADNMAASRYAKKAREQFANEVRRAR